MFSALFLPIAFVLHAAAGSSLLQPRLDNGVARTPPMGWNTYNHYSCSPNESIVHSNAKAIVDLGLADLGYRYITTDCGWTVANRTADGALTWDETLFPQGFPALGRYLHDLGLLFGVYQDSGIKLCGSPPDQVGSLYHEKQDAETFASWEIDSLKYDNCYSDASTNYPNVNYSPSTSPRTRFSNMSSYITAQNRPILFQVCEWGIDFPALWAPSLGHTWRIGNDIIPAWRSIFRTLNQAVPQTSFAGPGQWPDLDMLEVGNGVLSLPEEQTHFSMWAILKSPLTIGAALKDDANEISGDSLAVLKQRDVIAFNQDSLGVSAALRRRWTEQGYEVWSGPLSGGRTVVALINWRNETRDLTLDLPDVGIQHAGKVKNIWDDSVANSVRTAYTATVEGHGTMLLELQDTTEAGYYPAKVFAKSAGGSAIFDSVYASTTSNKYTATVILSQSARSSASDITIESSAGKQAVSRATSPSTANITATISLTAGSNNTITITPASLVEAIQITSPTGTYYPSTNFTITGSATRSQCGEGFCQPVGSKIGNISPSGAARAMLTATSTGSKYLEIDYINNDVAFDSSWGWGANSRNLTVAVNGGELVRLEVPLSGRHSELDGPGLGWWDTATLGILTEGWVAGENEVVVGNVGGEDGFTSFGADLVGLRLFS